MNVDQSKLNNEYREILNRVYGGEITLSDKYINPNTVLKHHCKNCKVSFWARPLWLVNKRQPHECHFAAIASQKVKKDNLKKATGTKKGNSTPNKVTDSMKLTMIQQFQQGDSLKAIARRFEVTPQTIKRHLEKAGVR